MSTTVLNIITLAERTDRRNFLIKQLTQQKIQHRLWYGFKVQGKPFTGISKSHKQIIDFAKNSGLSSVTVAEDDIQFTSPKSWKYYLDNMPEEYDIYLGSVSGGVVDEASGTVAGWSGMILYTVHQRFYDTFLKADENKNIDRWLSGVGLEEVERILGRPPVYKICYPIAAICVDGFSDNSGKEVKHEDYFKAYKKFQ